MNNNTVKNNNENIRIAILLNHHHTSSLSKHIDHPFKLQFHLYHSSYNFICNQVTNLRTVVSIFIHPSIYSSTNI